MLRLAMSASVSMAAATDVSGDGPGSFFAADLGLRIQGFHLNALLGLFVHAGILALFGATLSLSSRRWARASSALS